MCGFRPPETSTSGGKTKARENPKHEKKKPAEAGFFFCELGALLCCLALLRGLALLCHGGCELVRMVDMSTRLRTK